MTTPTAPVTRSPIARLSPYTRRMLDASVQQSRAAIDIAADNDRLANFGRIITGTDAPTTQSVDPGSASVRSGLNDVADVSARAYETARRPEYRNDPIMQEGISSLLRDVGTSTDNILEDSPYIDARRDYFGSMFYGGIKERPLAASLFGASLGLPGFRRVVGNMLVPNLASDVATATTGRDIDPAWRVSDPTNPDAYRAAMLQAGVMSPHRLLDRIYHYSENNAGPDNQPPPVRSTLADMARGLFMDRNSVRNIIQGDMILSGLGAPVARGLHNLGTSAAWARGGNLPLQALGRGLRNAGHGLDFLAQKNMYQILGDMARGVSRGTYNAARRATPYAYNAVRRPTQTARNAYNMARNPVRTANTVRNARATRSAVSATRSAVRAPRQTLEAGRRLLNRDLTSAVRSNAPTGHATGAMRNLVLLQALFDQGFETADYHTLGHDAYARSRQDLARQWSEQPLWRQTARTVTNPVQALNTGVAATGTSARDISDNRLAGASARDRGLLNLQRNYRDILRDGPRTSEEAGFTTTAEDVVEIARNRVSGDLSRKGLSDATDQEIDLATQVVLGQIRPAEYYEQIEALRPGFGNRRARAALESIPIGSYEYESPLRALFSR